MELYEIYEKLEQLESAIYSSNEADYEQVRAQAAIAILQSQLCDFDAIRQLRVKSNWDVDTLNEHLAKGSVRLADTLVRELIKASNYDNNN